MKLSINLLGVLAMACLLLGAIPGLGILASIMGFILTTWLYARIDKLNYGTNLFNFSLSQWFLVLIPTGILMYLGIDNYLNQSKGILFLIFTLLFALLLFLAIANYFIAKSLILIGEKTNNSWLKLSGYLTKIGAFSLPVVVGLLFIILAQPFFLLGCITFQHNGYASGTKP